MLTIAAKSGAFKEQPSLKNMKGLAGGAEDDAGPYDNTAEYQSKWLQIYDENAEPPKRIVVSYKETDVTALDKYAKVISKVGDVWSKPYATEGSTLVRTEQQDAVLTVIAEVKNSVGSLWCQLSDGNWVYSGNLRTTINKPEQEPTPKLGYVVLRVGTWAWNIPDKINGDVTRAIASGAKLGVDEIKEVPPFTWYRLTTGGWIDADAVKTPLEVPVTAPSIQPTEETAAQQSTTAPTQAPTTAPATKPTTAPTVKPITKPTTAPTGMPVAKPTETTTGATTKSTVPTEKPTVAVTEAPATEVTQTTAAETTEQTQVTTATEVTDQPTQAPEPESTELKETEKKGSGIKWVIVLVVVFVLIGAGDAAFILIKKKK